MKKHKSIWIIISMIGLLTLMMTGTAVADCDPFNNGTAGNDNILCDAANPAGGGASVEGNAGNDTLTTNPGGTDTTNEFNGGSGNDSLVVNADVQSATGSEGNDTIIQLSGNINGDITGDDVDGNGGDDSIVVGGDVDFNVIGDDASLNGGKDTIVILSNATVGESVHGDNTNGNGGDDTIIIQGDVSGFVLGDNADGDGGNDSIVIDGGFVGNRVAGGRGDDTILVHLDGTVAGDIYGEDDEGNAPGNDSIVIDGSVDGNIWGDHDEDEGDNGGNDTIIVNGAVNDVNGDGANDDGGDDSIVIAKGVASTVSGDRANSNGGDDTIVIDQAIVAGVNGDLLIDGGNGGDDTIIINANAVVLGDIDADDINDDGNGGNDLVIVNGIVGQDVDGDDIEEDGNGGHDTIIINGTVRDDVDGDDLDGGGTGGNDSIVLNAGALVEEQVRGDRFADDSGQVGGDDTIIVNAGATVLGEVIGDAWEDSDGGGLGGRDSIVIGGTVGNVKGDDQTFEEINRSRRDTISVSGSVTGFVSGDFTVKAGSRDTITISGTVELSVNGDDVNRAGASDVITVTSTGLVKRNVAGDLAKTIQGGNDTILVQGTARNVYGDLFRSSAKPDADGGDDVITIDVGGLVTKNVVGDSAPDAGGDDSITVAGVVQGDVIGDQVGGMGGIDTFNVTSTGKVKGDIVGDDAGTPANAGNGGDDVFVINGTVEGTVWLDNVGGPTLDVAGDADAIDLAIGGDDIIYVAGQIHGNISSASGNDGDDVFVIADGGVVDGMMDAGSHVDGDSLVFDLSTKSKGEFGKLSDLFDGLRVEDGTVSYRGNDYNWVNFEFLDYVVQLLQTRTIPLYCSGIYEKNDAGTACVRKGQEEYDAVMFHRNNPGYDGRLPGTEACAIYNYGGGMRVYEIIDGSEGELVTTISADVFNHNIEGNLLLASSTSGNVNVYYLTSNEIQVECTWAGKTQVRIIPDFSGAVNASFDKDA